MFVISKHDDEMVYALVCDDDDCTARTDASQARAAGWAITRTLGPHLCPADVNRRFLQRMNETFTEPLP